MSSSNGNTPAGLNSGWSIQTTMTGIVAFDDGDVVGERGYGIHVDRPV